MKLQAATTQLKPFFRFPFQEAQARSRFLAGSGLLLGGFIVPIIPGLFAYGYALRILRSTAEGEAPSMPAWDDWASLLSLGVRGAIISLIFMLPSLSVFLLGLAIYFATFLLIPLSAASEANGNDPFFVLLLLAMGALFASMAIGSVLLILGTIPLPVSISHFVMKDRLGAAFRVREWWPILSANRLGYFISFVIVSGFLWLAYYVFFVLYSTFILLCLAFLIMAPIGFYAMLVAASLFGETYREGAGLLQKHQ